MFTHLKTTGQTFKRELAVYRCVLRDSRTPFFPKALLGLAVGYTLLPFDLIPDFIPVLGLLDDVVIVPLLVLLARRMIPPAIVVHCRAQAAMGTRD